jgi:ribosomal protein L11 methyltransferase
VSAAFHLKGDFSSRDAETALLWEAGCRGIEERDGELVAYFARPITLPLAGEWRELDEIDWLEKYYQELKPVRVGRVIVSPSHCQVNAQEGEVVVRLDPGMAFGTGHHLTTRWALTALQELELKGKRVLDLGSGSGLLAIAADLLGATSLGLDIDPVAVAVAEENRDGNLSKAEFRQGSLDGTIPPASFDIVVANLYAELHAELAADYQRVLAPQGMLIATGILEERFEPVLKTFKEHFSSVEARLEEGWALVVAR